MGDGQASGSKSGGHGSVVAPGRAKVPSEGGTPWTISKVLPRPAKFKPARLDLARGTVMLMAIIHVMDRQILSQEHLIEVADQ